MIVLKYTLCLLMNDQIFRRKYKRQIIFSICTDEERIVCALHLFHLSCNGTRVHSLIVWQMLIQHQN